MGLPLKKDERKFTYADYLTWPEDERWELIEGIPYNMTPAPSRIHQKILGDLHRQFSTYLLDKKCEVYAAPFDVVLPEESDEDSEIVTVVQPDLVVVCDEEKLDEKGCRGAPDLVVEILSPSTARRDLKEKLLLYERVGVREYWVVHPHEKVVEVFRLCDTGEYGKPEAFTPGDELRVGIFADFAIDLEAAFRH